MKLPGNGNWALKLIALALAIVIYHALKNDSVSKTNTSHDRPFFQTR